jgi:hypothetical protein
MFRLLSLKSWFVLGLIGCVVGVSAACSVASPVSPSSIATFPSSMSGVGLALNPSSSLRSVGLASFGLDAADILSAAGERGSGRNGARRAKGRQFCEALLPGHEKYARCQRWLKPGPGDRSQIRARLAKRRQFCEALLAGHEKYEPCQRWLARRNERRR